MLRIMTQLQRLPMELTSFLLQLLNKRKKNN